MITDSSCLASKLSHYIQLNDDDNEMLASLEKSERNYDSGALVHESGDENKELYVVKSGWAFSYTDLQDGRRQIVRIHHPGDFIGFPDLAMKQMTTSLRTFEKACLCPFPKSSLDVILRESPKLAALLLSIALRDQVVLIDLLRALGRMSAQERVSYMLLDLIARLRVTNPETTDTLRLPMTQSHIADYLGLTNVYISKTFHQMEQAGYIRRQNQNLQILKEDEMIRLTDFDDRYVEMDISWFPGR